MWWSTRFTEGEYKEGRESLLKGGIICVQAPDKEKASRMMSDIVSTKAEDLAKLMGHAFVYVALEPFNEIKGPHGTQEEAEVASQD